MSETHRGFKRDRTDNDLTASSGAAAAWRRSLCVLIGVLCGMCLLFVAQMAQAQPKFPSGYVDRSAQLRAMKIAASLYRIDSPLQFEEHVVKLEFSSSGKGECQWQFPREALTLATPGPEGFAGIVEWLKQFGEPTVLHSGVWTITGNEETYTYSGKSVPVETAKAPNSRTVEYKEVGRRLTLHIDGLDKEGRINFNYIIELTRMVNETRGGDPTFLKFNTEARAKLQDGETLLIPNVDGSTGLLIFLTPRIVQ